MALRICIHADDMERAIADMADPFGDGINLLQFTGGAYDEWVQPEKPLPHP